ncbi:Crp/Fnr family transcriptional regulator [Kordiimonas sp.]|uniref:Crp/Fnr family transcriptional regulator n=1 Tax=Kordiimonas sp. TaxID=1970157 RepID=UPI003A8EDF13
MSALIDLFKERSPRPLAIGKYLFHRDQTVDQMFMVHDGEIRLIRHQADGNEVILQRAYSGDLLAEASLFSERYHCDAIAATPSKIRALPKSSFLAALQTDLDLATFWAKRLAQEVQRARLRSEIVSLKTVAQRLDAWLAWNGDIPSKGEWRALAFEIAVSPEALYRELGKRRASSFSRP